MKNILRMFAGPGDVLPASEESDDDEYGSGFDGNLDGEEAKPKEEPAPAPAPADPPPEPNADPAPAAAAPAAPAPEGDESGAPKDDPEAVKAIEEATEAAQGAKEAADAAQRRVDSLGDDTSAKDKADAQQALEAATQASQEADAGLKKLTGESGADKLKAAEEYATQQAEAAEAAAVEAVLQEVEKVHPSARQTVQTPAFLNWVATQDQETQRKVYAGSAQEGIEVLNAYAESNKQEDKKPTPLTDEDLLAIEIEGEDGKKTTLKSLIEGEDDDGYGNEILQLVKAVSQAMVASQVSGINQVDPQMLNQYQAQLASQAEEIAELKFDRQIRGKHADYHAIEASDAYRKEWLPKQSERIQEIATSYDVDGVAMVIDAYKAQQVKKGAAESRTETQRTRDLHSSTLRKQTGQKKSPSAESDDYDGGFEQQAQPAA